MKRVSLGWACRQAAVLGLAVFIGVGFYGVFHFLFGTTPPPRVTFLLGNVSVPGGVGRGGVGEDRSLTSLLQVGEIQPNCGLEQVCADDHFPVRVYSGKTKDDHPRVCVSGRYVIERDINNGGRGINLVIVNPQWMKAVVARRFDTYARDSADLELFLSREVGEGDILVAVTFDEASRNLSPAARNLLADPHHCRGWEGWQWDGRWEREVVLPDISRVLRRPLGCDLQPTTPLIQALFHRLRATNLEMTAPIQNADSLTAHRYEAHLSALLNTSSSSLVLTPGREEVLRCADERDLTHLLQFNRLFLNVTEGRPRVVVLPYREEGAAGFEGMKVLCRCFGLFHDQHSPPRGLHRGLLRFSMRGSQIFLLSNHSPHFTLPPYTTTITLTLP